MTTFDDEPFPLTKHARQAYQDRMPLVISSTRLPRVVCSEICMFLWYDEKEVTTNWESHAPFQPDGFRVVSMRLMHWIVNHPTHDFLCLKSTYGASVAFFVLVQYFPLRLLQSNPVMQIACQSRIPNITCVFCQDLLDPDFRRAFGLHSFCRNHKRPPEQRITIFDVFPGINLYYGYPQS
jgi:hypothetical protein